MNRKIVVKTLALILILGLGFVVQRSRPVDMAVWLEDLETAGQYWWMPFLLVGLMIVFFALALPGSLLIFVCGMFYRPWLATALTMIGGALGGLAGFYVIRFLSEGWRRRIVATPLFESMRKHSGGFPLFMFRVFPGFPHSAINYGAGILGLKPWPFAVSSLLGFAIKGFVYTSAAYNATHLEASRELGEIGAMWPLLAIALLALAGYVLKRLHKRKRSAMTKIAP